jgi:Zn-dependent protease
MDARIYGYLVEFIVLLFSLSIHESAHAWTADRLGDPTARNLGRVSLNPLVHTDPFGTILLPLMGLFLGGFLIGWAKPTPVIPSRLRNPRRDHVIVAAAGPISNLLIAAFLFACLMLMKNVVDNGSEIIYRVYASEFFGNSVLVPLIAIAYHGVMLNLLLAIFNFIPVPPLDGATVLTGILPESIGNVIAGMQAYSLVLLMALLYLGVLDRLYSPVYNFVLSYLI